MGIKQTTNNVFPWFFLTSPFNLYHHQVPGVLVSLFAVLGSKQGDFTLGILMP